MVSNENIKKAINDLFLVSSNLVSILYKRHFAISTEICGVRKKVAKLKGHSQLMRMRIRYHFLADLHVTRHECETESEKRIRNTQKKPC